MPRGSWMQFGTTSYYPISVRLPDSLYDKICTLVHVVRRGVPLHTREQVQIRSLFRNHYQKTKQGPNFSATRTPSATFLGYRRMPWK
ncbi:hypothetical protein E4T56_gene11918 [Termitomyces sp. T112]|nr:hypothetical protein E4T56_gene11918 [Termitomyces sp. T112]